MRKKCLLSLLTIIMAVIVSISFVSCDHHNNVTGNNGDEGKENKPLTESQKFVGYWDGEDTDNKWVFYPDGKCCRIEVYGTGYNVYRKSGSWSYDETTKTLITTVESNQFLINYISDDAWAGLSLKHGGSISRTRDNIGYARELINGKTWKGTNGTISITATSQYSGSNYNGKLNNIVWCLEGWESDSGFPECKDPASFYKEGEYQGIARTWYRVKVERCINVSSASFESSSSMLLQATIDDDYGSS